jgi:hypothetical protein
MRLSPSPKAHPLRIQSRHVDPLCSICNRRVSLENAKTDEHGLAVHEECYVLKLRLKRASSETLPEPRHRLSLVYSNRKQPEARGRSTEKGFAL